MPCSLGLPLFLRWGGGGDKGRTQSLLACEEGPSVSWGVEW